MTQRKTRLGLISLIWTFSAFALIGVFGSAVAANDTRILIGYLLMLFMSQILAIWGLCSGRQTKKDHAMSVISISMFVGVLIIGFILGL